MPWVLKPTPHFEVESYVEPPYEPSDVSASAANIWQQELRDLTGKVNEAGAAAYDALDAPGGTPDGTADKQILVWSQTTGKWEPWRQSWTAFSMPGGTSIPSGSAAPAYSLSADLKTVYLRGQFQCASTTTWTFPAAIRPSARRAITGPIYTPSYLAATNGRISPVGSMFHFIIQTNGVITLYADTSYAYSFDGIQYTL